MNFREDAEKREENFLSCYAAKSSKSEGRKREEAPCEIRTCFQRDRDRIVHSKAFRRLMHKTQVFIAPEGDHYRTRLTHTLEVSQISRTIASALMLNQDLTEAIALGHDLGHTPFGHLGERELDEVMADGFHHNEQSVRVCEKLERNGKGLNLTYEVLDGILNHRGAGSPSTLEGKIVQISDKIAYVNHDIDDALRAGIIKETDLPSEYIDVVGESHGKRIDFLIKNIIVNSYGKNDIIMEPSVKKPFYDLRKYLFEMVYKGKALEYETAEYSNKLKRIFDYYKNNFEKLPEEYRKIANTDENKERIVCDYIAGMTDRYARELYRKLFLY